MRDACSDESPPRATMRALLSGHAGAPAALTTGRDTAPYRRGGQGENAAPTLRGLRTCSWRPWRLRPGASCVSACRSAPAAAPAVPARAHARRAGAAPAAGGGVCAYICPTDVYAYIMTNVWVCRNRYRVHAVMGKSVWRVRCAGCRRGRVPEWARERAVTRVWTALCLLSDVVFETHDTHV